MVTIAPAQGIDEKNIHALPMRGLQRAGLARTRSVTSALFVLTDFALIWLSAAIALWCRFYGTSVLAPYWTHLTKTGAFLVLFSVLVVLFCHTQRLYRVGEIRVGFDEAFAVLKAIVLALLVLATSVYLSGQAVVSRLTVGATVVMTATLLIAWRRYRRRRMSRKVAAGHNCRHVLIMGRSEFAHRLKRYLSANTQLGYSVKGLIDCQRGLSETAAEGGEQISDDVLGHIDELRDIVRAHFIDELFIVLPQERELVKEAVARAGESGIGVRIIPDQYDGLVWGAPIERLGLFPALHVYEKRVPVLGLLLKRWFDVILSAAALAVCSPVFLVIAIAIKIDSPGPILYRSRRVGKKGKAFICYKFRTMVEHAEALQETLRDRNIRDGVLFKIPNDPRLTRSGHFMRKYSLDELPQLWNVLKNDMSLVGPRPPLPGEVVQYELNHLKRLDVLPGITGLWQVEARRDPSFESYINFDAYYVDNWSLGLDVKIILKTLTVVLAGTGQ